MMMGYLCTHRLPREMRISRIRRLRNTYQSPHQRAISGSQFQNHRPLILLRQSSPEDTQRHTRLLLNRLSRAQLQRTHRAGPPTLSWGQSAAIHVSVGIRVCFCVQSASHRPIVVLNASVLTGRSIQSSALCLRAALSRRQALQRQHPLHSRRHSKLKQLGKQS